MDKVKTIHEFQDKIRSLEQQMKSRVIDDEVEAWQDIDLIDEIQDEVAEGNISSAILMLKEWKTELKKKIHG